MIYLKRGRQHSPPTHSTSKDCSYKAGGESVSAELKLAEGYKPTGVNPNIKITNHQKKRERSLLTSSLNQISRPLNSVSSSSNSPIPSKQARSIISVHPGTFLTIFGPASDKLIINTKALRRKVERSSRSSS